MPVKLTWKSVVGFLSMLLGIITAATASGVFTGQEQAILIGVGGFIVAVERLADAFDHQTDTQAVASPEHVIHSIIPSTGADPVGSQAPVVVAPVVPPRPGIVTVPAGTVVKYATPGAS